MFNELNTLKPFLEQPSREFNVREIARILKVAPATASKMLKLFSEKSILKEKKERGFNLYKSNLEEDLYRDIKIFYTLRKVKESGLIESIDKFYLKPIIILFGSAAYGLDTETSDLDFLIVSENTKKIENLDKFEKILKRRIQLFIVKDIKDLKNDHLINNVINGIKIQGEIKWI